MGTKDDVFSGVNDVLSRIPIDFGGGCSRHKALVMAWLIQAFDLKTTLDIGVYRGRSLFPQAVAHKTATGGVVYGVDPWSSVEAAEFDNIPLREKIDDFVQKTDFNDIYSAVSSLKEGMGFSSNCVLVRKTSAEASPWFDDQKIRFDLIHVDGNHDTERVMEDLELYLPKLNRGGFIVLDDISWDSVQPAYDKLCSKMKLLWKNIDKNKMNDFAVFWDEGSFMRVLMTKIKIAISVPSK